MAAKQTSICVFDFRHTFGKIDKDKIIKWLKDNCKSWVFQREMGESGYDHYQGRFSLRKKIYNTVSRKQQLFKDIDMFEYMEPTLLENVKNDFYVTKADTRIEGPWSDKDKVRQTFVPDQYQIYVDNLLPFQQTIIDSIKVKEYRKINVVIDKSGNNGKSIVAAIGELLYGGIDMPPLNDFDDIMQIIHSELADNENVNPGIIFFDLPRAMDQSRLFGILSAFEQIKKGKCYDKRYKYRKWWFNSPQIWLFCNWELQTDLLSKDRWNLWTINNKKELIVYEQTVEQPK